MMFGAGIMEMLIVMLLGVGGLGLPMGMPPTAEDPMVAKVAPEKCLFYTSWAGMAKPDPESPNRTEQLLAEQEVQHFVERLEVALTAAVIKNAPPSEAQKVLFAEAPKIVKAILTRPGALFVENVKPDLATRGVEVAGGLIVNTGDETAEIMAAVLRIEAAMDGLVKEVIEGGITLKEITMPDGNTKIRWGFRGHYLMIGIGDGSYTGMLDRGRSAEPTWLSDLRTEMPIKRRSTITYVNVQRIRDLALTFSPDADVKRVVAALGLGNITTLSSVTGFDELGITSRTRLGIDGKPTGIFAVAAAEPLSAADLGPIPRDATIALAARFDLEKAFRDFRAGIASVDPGDLADFDEAVDEMKQASGIDLSEDIFKALGDTWRVYNSPGEGGLLITGMTAVGTVRDAAKLEKALEKIEKFVQSQVPKEDEDGEDGGRHHWRRSYATIKHFEFAGRKIYFTNFVGAESPVAPAWCVTDKEFVISTFPSHIKAYLSRGTDHKSIAEVPEVAKLFSGDKGPVAVSYQDTRALFRMAYPIIQIIAQFGISELQRQGFDLDIAMLPSAPVIAKYLTPGTMSITHTDEGIEMVSQQTLPIGGGGAMIGLPAMLYFSMMIGGGRIGPDVEFAVPLGGGAERKARERPRIMEKTGEKRKTRVKEKTGG